MAKLPQVMQDMIVYLADESFAGHINKMTLPDIAIKTAEKVLSGAAGTIDISLGRLEKMTSEVTIEAYSRLAIGLVGSNKGRDELLVCRGALLNDGVVVPVVIRFSGLWTKLGLGDLSPEKEIETTTTVSIEHFEFEMDGQELVYIDKLSNIVRLNGEDLNADVRAALGQ